MPRCLPYSTRMGSPFGPHEAQHNGAASDREAGAPSFGKVINVMPDTSAAPTAGQPVVASVPPPNNDQSIQHKAPLRRALAVEQPLARLESRILEHEAL